ncbi:hypothetical protein ACVR0S_01880 [Streptococcus dentapri]|uniref:DUF2750 domain-containing protein n=1 Tax=Streptococcus dentapri TaxID=573564 RepID=A0ABV8D2D2_9STRE
MTSIEQLLKEEQTFSLSFDRRLPISFQQQFWRMIAYLTKHEIPWFNGEKADDHFMCQQFLGQQWEHDYQSVVIVFRPAERYLGWQYDDETDEWGVSIQDVYGFRWNHLAQEADYTFDEIEEFQETFVDTSDLTALFGKK